MSTQQGSSRLHHLDSLRGVAALAVAYHHTMDAFSNIPNNKGFIDAFAGKSSVFFFFLLSGFVLSKSLNKELYLTKRILVGYLFRRIFRIYPVVFLSLIFSIILTKILIFPIDWNNGNWLENCHVAIQNFYGWTNYTKAFLVNDFVLNPPLWSIRVELICSLMLPFMVILFKKYQLAIIPVGVLLASYLEWGTGFPKFMFVFYLGYLIERLSPSFNKISKKHTMYFLLIGFIMLIISCQHSFDFFFDSIVLAIILAVLVPCNWPKLMSILQISPLKTLGRISYSFYLLHFPLLYFSWACFKLHYPSFIDLQPSIIPAAVLFITSVLVTFPLAYLSEKYIEAPFNLFGHRIARCF